MYLLYTYILDQVKQIFTPRPIGHKKKAGIVSHLSQILKKICWTSYLPAQQPS